MILGLTDKQITAIEAVLDIAIHGGAGAVQSGEVTARRNISRRYLEPVLQQLSRADVLVGIRGPSGGYRLARERRRITLGDLVRALAAIDEAPARAPRADPPAAVVHAVLGDLERDILSQLDAITVEDLYWRVRRAEGDAPGVGPHDYTI